MPALRHVRESIEGKDIAVVVSTWKNIGGKVHGALSHRQIARVIPASFVRILPIHFHYDALYRAFPSVERLLLDRYQSASSVTPEDLRAILPGSTVEVQDESDIAPPWLAQVNQTNRNQYYMLYKIARANHIKRDLEISRGRRFDVVWRLRPDCIIDLAPPPVEGERDLFLDWLDHRSGIAGDIALAGASWAQDQLADAVFAFIERHIDGAARSDLPWNGHQSLYRFLVDRGLNLRHLGARPSLTDTVIVTEDEIAEAIAMDAAGRPTSPEHARLHSTVILFAGERALAAGNHDEAAEHAALAIAMWPANAHARDVLSRVAFAKGDHTEALRLAATAARIADDYPVPDRRFSDELWSLCHRTRDLGRAFDVVSAELAQRAGSPSLNLVAAWILETRKLPEDAMRHAQAALAAGAGAPATETVNRITKSLRERRDALPG